MLRVLETYTVFNTLQVKCNFSLTFNTVNVSLACLSIYAPVNVNKDSGRKAKAKDKD